MMSRNIGGVQHLFALLLATEWPGIDLAQTAAQPYLLSTHLMRENMQKTTGRRGLVASY